jgi:hypothetical protein
MEFTAVSANRWPISLVRLGSSFVINEIMSITYTSHVSMTPLLYPSASHPHTQPERRIFKGNHPYAQRKGKKEEMFMEWKRAKDGASLYVGWVI